MKKYIFIIIIETLICYYWLIHKYITYLNNSLLIMYIVGFPIIYLIFFVISLRNKREWYLYFLSFVPIIFAFMFTYLVDGRTTFQSNPDSSIHGWFYFFNFLRFIIQIGSIGIVGILYYLIKKGLYLTMNKRFYFAGMFSSAKSIFLMLLDQKITILIINNL